MDGGYKSTLWLSKQSFFKNCAASVNWRGADVSINEYEFSRHFLCCVWGKLLTSLNSTCFSIYQSLEAIKDLFHFTQFGWTNWKGTQMWMIAILIFSGIRAIGIFTGGSNETKTFMEGITKYDCVCHDDESNKRFVLYSRGRRLSCS